VGDFCTLMRILLLALMSIWLYVTLLLWQASKTTKDIQNEEQDAEEGDSEKRKVSTCTGKEFLNYIFCNLGTESLGGFCILMSVF